MRRFSSSNNYAANCMTSSVSMVNLAKLYANGALSHGAVCSDGIKSRKESQYGRKRG